MLMNFISTRLSWNTVSTQTQERTLWLQQPGYQTPESQWFPSTPYLTVQKEMPASRSRMPASSCVEWQLFLIGSPSLRDGPRLDSQSLSPHQSSSSMNSTPRPPPPPRSGFNGAGELTDKYYDVYLNLFFQWRFSKPFTRNSYRQCQVCSFHTRKWGKETIKVTHRKITDEQGRKTSSCICTIEAFDWLDAYIINHCIDLPNPSYINITFEWNFTQVLP